jgi:flagellin
VLNGDNAGQVVTLEDVDNTEGIKIIYYDSSGVSASSITQSYETKDKTSYSSDYDNLKNALKTQIVPQAVTEIISAYPVFNYLNGLNIGIGLKLSTPSLDTNLSKTTLAYVAHSNKVYSDDTVDPTEMSYELCINLDSIQLDSSYNLTADSRQKLEVTIVHEMMHAFMDESLTNGMVGIVDGVLAKDDAYPKWFKEGMAQTAAGAYYNNNDWINNGLGITTSTSESQIENILNQNKLGNTDSASCYGTGYLACMYLGYLAGGSTGVDETTIKTGLSNIIADLYSGTSLNDVVKKYTGYNLTQFQNNFASDAASFVKQLTATVGNNTGGLVKGFALADDILDDNTLTVSLFELNTNYSWVTNNYPSDYPTLTGGSKTNTKSGVVTNVSDISISSIFGSSASSKYSGLTLHVGADATSNNKITIYIDAMSAKILGLLDVSVKTQDSSRYSIERVALALARVSEQRSELGSYQNRLEHTIKNLDNVVENTTASESQIRDTDMATEMVKFSNTNILRQVGQSMLAQANQTNQGVLNLLS